MPLISAASADDLRNRGSITEADVATLRRAFMADGVIDAAEAETLLALHHMPGDKHASWGDCFVELVADFLVEQSRPEGYLTFENAEWLAGRIAPNGAVETKAEIELLVTALDKARWSPQSLIAFALDQVRRAVVDDAGPLRAGKELGAGKITEAEVELVKRMLYAYGGDGTNGITRVEAEILFEIDDATRAHDSEPSWSDLFVKVMANCVMTASGFAAPCREQALTREAWFQKRKDDQEAGVLSYYRQQSTEQRAISMLERQKVEIVTAEEIVQADAAWLCERIGRDGEPSKNERALLELLAQHNPELAPDFTDLLGRLQTAA